MGKEELFRRGVEVISRERSPYAQARKEGEELWKILSERIRRAYSKEEESLLWVGAEVKFAKGEAFKGKELWVSQGRYGGGSWLLLAKPNECFWLKRVEEEGPLFAVVPVRGEKEDEETVAVVVYENPEKVAKKEGVEVLRGRLAEKHYRLLEEVWRDASGNYKGLVQGIQDWRDML